MKSKKMKIEEKNIKSKKTVDSISDNSNKNDDWTVKKFSNPDATIRVATMFSGIGSIEHALKRLNLKEEIVFACDNDKFVKQSYFANYEISESSWYDDVQNIDGSKYWTC